MTLISFVGSGRYSDVFKVSDGRHAVIMKLSFYRDTTWCDFVKKMKQGDAVGARHVKNQDSIMVSAAFGNAANDLIARNVSPHFVWVYCYSDCRDMAPRLKSLISERMKTSSKIQLRFNNVCFMEVFTSDMTKWLRGRSRDLTETTIRAALCGVLYTLAALQKLYPGFRHNDLSSNNILIKKLTKQLRASYTINGATYYVSTPVLVALNDWDFSHVPDHPKLANERVINGRYKVTEAPNTTYDTHFFLKSVLKSLYLASDRFPAVTAFLKSLPLESEDRLDTKNIPGLEPAVLLTHDYFRPLTTKPRSGQITDVFAV